MISPFVAIVDFCSSGGHDLLQHDIEEGVEAVGRSTTEPMSLVAGHDDDDKNRGL
jgi:hypothetical protein